MVDQVFIHIPKTAGTLARHLLQRRRIPLGCAYPTPPFKTLAQMQEDEIEALRRCKVFIGHEDYATVLALFGPDADYFTIVRNPVDRVISYYNHAMSYFPQFATRKLSLMRFLENDGNYELDNLQLRYLSGNPKTALVARDDLDRAKRFVSEGKVRVGIQELLGKSLDRLAIFGPDASANLAADINKSQFGYGRDSFTKAEIAAIAAKNRLDCELYDFCRERFEAT